MQPTSTTPSTARVALKYGAMTGLALVIYQLILYMGQLDTVTVLSLLIFAFPIMGIVLAIKAFRSLNGNHITYGQGFGVGTLVGAITGILVGFFDSIYLHVIDPSVMKRRLDYTIERLERSNFSSEIIDKMVEQAGRTTAGQTFASNAFTYLIFGVIVSLIVAAVMKREKNIFDE
jgi:hypothetical protein